MLSGILGTSLQENSEEHFNDSRCMSVYKSSEHPNCISEGYIAGSYTVAKYLNINPDIYVYSLKLF